MQVSTLIREAKHGSAAAQKCLFDLCAPKMMLVCRRYVKSAEDAEEVLLDGFYKIFRALPQFRYEGDDAFHGWIKQIMVNECLMLIRKRSPFTVISETAAEEIPFPAEVFSTMSASEILLLVIQLPIGYRTVFNLHAIEGFTHPEIATMLGIKEGTSRSQLAKAKQLLQKMILINQPGYGSQQSK
ncbi:MAG TPA: sigma-70 family RNA polymerase sigma factor [Flavitalea sp.]|nr:sigma-70 family RNA polymerase sigma factor [Flavitalea sp.]